MRGLALLLAAVVLAVGGLVAAAACGGDQPTPAASPSGPVVLTIVGEDTERTFTMTELQELPAYEGYAGIKSSTGVITPPEKYTGVALGDLTDLVGGISEANGVTILAKDGYGMTFSHNQIVNREFTAYDPATGEEEVPSAELTVVIAYARDGEPLEEGEGPLRLVVAEPEPGGQVVDGHWSIKWLDRIEVRDASAQWKVQVEGAVPAELDRPSYVNCASPGCHGSGWVDDEGTRWEGIPLYLVAGMVDDGKKHDAGAYDRALARAGYEIQIETADGEVVAIDSRRIDGKRSIVLSSKVDGGELPDEYFPLRLVGPGLTREQMPGRIVRIVVRVP